MGSSAPSPPDPYATAQAQSQANRAAARDQAAINMVNQNTPYGSLTYTRTPGTTFGTGVGGGFGGSDQPGGYTATQTFNPEVQAVIDRQIANANESGKIGGMLQHNVEQTASKPLDLSYSALQGELDKRNRNTLDPLWRQREEEERQQLYNRGITPGNQAFDSETRRFDTSRNAAYDQAFSNDQAQAQNALTTQYNSPINAAQAWRTGAQIQPTPLGLTQTPQESISPAPSLI